ncbi:hypothetical protein GCM10009863_47370 [Streptomyces axinellae]|uniref:Integral membrane protein n=1 Tax=Streptomyces axinellae TaxID=552788 RepID=A0ABN3QI09_9ACTN
MRRAGPLRRLGRVVGPVPVGRRIFLPSRPGRVEDARVARIQKMRTLVGLAAFSFVALSYRLAGTLKDVAEDRFDQSWYSILALAVTLPLVIAALAAFALPARRRELLRRALGPLGAMFAIFAGMVVFPASVLTGFSAGRFAVNPFMTVVTAIGLLFTVAWVLPFVIYGVAMSLVHVFRSADIHETVPPLVAMTVVWEMLLVDLVTGAYEGVPEALRVVMLLGAPVSVTLVGMWELRRLRLHYNLRLRGALMRDMR